LGRVPLENALSSGQEAGLASARQLNCG
jgi:hypothetical protein